MDIQTLEARFEGISVNDENQDQTQTAHAKAKVSRRHRNAWNLPHHF